MAIWSRDAAADAVRAFEPVPRQWIASLHDVGTRGAASVKIEARYRAGRRA
jgi:hypothetical protein